jgi:hypothetical protein
MTNTTTTKQDSTHAQARRISTDVSQGEWRKNPTTGNTEYVYLTRSTLEGEVEMIIDIDWLFRSVGEKALASKGGKAVEAGGAIKAVRRGSVRTIQTALEKIA